VNDLNNTRKMIFHHRGAENKERKYYFSIY